MIMSIIALDIGGTAVKYGIFGEKNEFGQFAVMDSDGVERLPEKIMEFLYSHKADYIGISAPGPFDFKTGTGLMEHKLKSLYKVSLREMIEKEFQGVKLFFIHDSVSFILGEISQNPSLADEKVGGVMLGTGLGYVNCIRGRASINEIGTPISPLWNMSYKDGIAENYVSATALKAKAGARGYDFPGVKEMAEAAAEGNKELLDVFSETGEDLGTLMKIKQREEGFDCLIIGGQVSHAWELMKGGFDKKCSIPYFVSRDPARTPLYGIKYFAERYL